MINKSILHKAEMELLTYCDNADVNRRMMREVIINKFTDLIDEAEE